jgi:endonuclease IV
MQVGYHVSRKDIKDAPQAIELACEAIGTYGFVPSLQIFLTNNMSGVTLFSDTQLKDIKKTLNNTGASMYVHGAYVHGPWNKSEKGCKGIIREMKMAKTCGAKGVVIHLSKQAYGENLAWALNYINESITDDSVVLFLEVNTAKSSQYTFETPEKLHALFEAVNKIKLNYKVGLCLDTAHLFSCGTPLSHTTDVEPWFKKLMSKIDHDIPLLIHLNDSASTFASGKDEHEKLCQGAIWNKLDDDCGLKAVLEWTQTYNVPIILERNENGDATPDLQILQKWHDTGALV